MGKRHLHSYSKAWDPAVAAEGGEKHSVHGQRHFHSYSEAWL